MKADRTIDKYKARLVIKGYRKKEDLDYFDTYSPVSRITSTRMILAIAALWNLEVHQMDVKIAFLNEYIDKEIYMEQPEGHVALGQERKDDFGVARTPIDISQHLSKNKGESVDQVEYARVIGSLVHLMSCTRPDIAFIVSSLSRFTSNPSENHWKAIVRVLRYLKYFRNYGLHYSKDLTMLEGFFDASWISDIQDTKGTSGYIFTLGGRAMLCKSSRQTIITRSTMESEFVALDKFGEEKEWI
ncbi:secreted RxLR effector protein 161-like [Gossypium raimondii]|uniref:secreted RxLR effector protein 161-like n=1 Tax=Gossypium raimondii TaxID=29730 RepID=UPI00227C7025|nr:secreted RxLR effector protein 161-like [Gossypium raimondii]